MPNYSLVISDSSGNNLGEITNFTSFSYSKKLNDFGRCEFFVPATDSKMGSLISLRRYDTKIYRNGTLVWAGQQALRNAQLTKQSSNLVTITSFEYLELLKHRETAQYRRFNNVDAGTIAWTMINESQALTNGDFGITQGSIATTQSRNREYENKNLYEAIKQLSEVINGFDFEITSNKVFNVYSRKGTDRTLTSVFEYGTNIKDVTIDENFSTVANQTIVLSEIERVERNDLTAQSIYGLYQDVVQAYNVTETSSSNEKGDANNQKYSSPLIKLTFNQLSNTRPMFGSIALGDTVKVKIKYGFYNIDNNFRVYGYDVKVGQNNQESINYTLGII